ncbi:hypothetical protein LN42_06385 [Marinitoga sp. 1137]|uniref:hypothetical protein n=1 Tax=Marinitoga sp. 1137 TaxID=1545835 RepID=UPI000950380C|nr:hypothetical protein [Marinitoga sp. 1137]APT76049.1 hypothetical protein LN42_06385 [Marinitoga sp. 1137]
MNEYINTNEFVRYMSLLNEKGEIEILENLIEQIFEFFIDEIENKKVKKEMINFVEEVLRIIDPESRIFYNIFFNNFYVFLDRILSINFDYTIELISIFNNKENGKIIELYKFKMIKYGLLIVEKKADKLSQDHQRSFLRLVEYIVINNIKKSENKKINYIDFKEIYSDFKNYNNPISVIFILEILKELNEFLINNEDYTITFYENQEKFIVKFFQIFKSLNDKNIYYEIINRYLAYVFDFIINLYKYKKDEEIFFEYILDDENEFNLFIKIYELFSESKFNFIDIIYIKKRIFLMMAKFLEYIIKDKETSIETKKEIIEIIVNFISKMFERKYDDIYLMETFFDSIEENSSFFDNIIELKKIEKKTIINAKIYFETSYDYRLELLLLFIYKSKSLNLYLFKDKIIEYFKEKKYEYDFFKKHLEHLKENLFKFKILDEIERENFEIFLKDFSEIIDILETYKKYNLEEKISKDETIDISEVDNKAHALKEEISKKEIWQLLENKFSEDKKEYLIGLRENFVMSNMMRKFEISEKKYPILFQVYSDKTYYDFLDFRNINFSLSKRVIEEFYTKTNIEKIDFCFKNKEKDYFETKKQMLENYNFIIGNESLFMLLKMKINLEDEKINFYKINLGKNLILTKKGNIVFSFDYRIIFEKIKKEDINEIDKLKHDYSMLLEQYSQNEEMVIEKINEKYFKAVLVLKGNIYYNNISDIKVLEFKSDCDM